jgi:hypothetical protein
LYDGRQGEHELLSWPQSGQHTDRLAQKSKIAR